MEPDEPGRFRQITPPTGMFVLASLAGWAPSIACSPCVIVPTGLVSADPVTRLFVGFGVSCFIGGVISGLLLEPGLRVHRQRLLWLMAGSPAPLAWACSLSWIVSGGEFSNRIALVVCFICAAAVAGSCLGCTLGRRYRVWVAEEEKREQASVSETDDSGTGERGEKKAPIHHSEKREGKG